MNIDVSFPGPKKVVASFKGFEVVTDMPVCCGGGEEAPTPFDLFASSVACCAGVYAQRFCDSREISMEGIKFSVVLAEDPESGLFRSVTVKLDLPDTFPAKYRNAICKAVGACTVKKQILNAPEFKVELV